MSGVFKSLQPKDVRVTPYRAHKLFVTAFDTDQSSSVDGIKVYQARYTTNTSYDFYQPGFTNADVGNDYYESLFPTTTDGYLQTVLLRQLDAAFYEYYLTNNGSTLGDQFINYQYRDLASVAKVISCANSVIGEGILPGSVVITGSGTGLTIVDDLYGNLKIVTAPGGVNSTGDPVDYDNVIYSNTFNKHYRYTQDNNLTLSDSVNYGNYRLQTQYSNVGFESIGTFGDVGVRLDSSTVELIPNNNTDVLELLNFTNKDYAIAFGLRVSQSLNKQIVLAKQSTSTDWYIDSFGNAVQNTNAPSNYPYKIYVSGSNANRKLYFEKTSGTKTLIATSSTALSSVNTYYDCVIQRSGSVIDMFVTNTKTTTTDTFYNASSCETDDLGCANTSTIKIGSNYDGTLPISGTLNYLHIFDRALTIGEIDDLTKLDGNINRFCGNVFYKQGLIVITNPFAVKYQLTSMSYRSTTTLLETEVYCTVGPGDFTRTFNRSLQTWNPDKKTYEIGCKFTGSAFRPYVTTVGLIV